MSNIRSPKTKLGKPERKFMEAALAQALHGMRNGSGGPFGAVIVKGGKIISQGHNEVLVGQDPTAHAEVVAIRKACKKLGDFHLEGCDLYTSCEPCPMCLSAAYWARIARIFYANTRQDAEQLGFGDAFIYQELAKPEQKRDLPMRPFLRRQAQGGFKEWRNMLNKTHYGPKLST